MKKYLYEIMHGYGAIKAKVVDVVPNSAELIESHKQYYENGTYDFYRIIEYRNPITKEIYSSYKVTWYAVSCMK